jgi:hypothetical protein
VSSTQTELLLAEEDLLCLKEKSYSFSVAQTDGLIYLIIQAYQIPASYNPTSVDLLLRLPPNFPMAKPDMFWTFPHVRLVNGSFPQAAAVFDVQYQERQWQRWSRHFTNWRPGVDNLKAFLATIRQELKKGI